MTVQITIEASSAEEARKEMRDLLGITAAPSEGLQVLRAADAESKRGRGRPPKVRPEEVTDIDGDGDPVEAETATEAAAAEVTKEDVRDAIIKLNRARGENACHTLVTKYGAKSASTVLQTGRGAEFIQEANAMIDMSDAVFAATFPEAVAGA